MTQIDVLEEYQLLLVLSNKSLVSYSLEALDASDNQSPLIRRPKKIQNHANFFQTGVCVGRHLVCSAKTSGISTTIKVFEPLDTVAKNKKKPAITQLFQSSQDALKPFKVRFNQYILQCTSINRVCRSSTSQQNPTLYTSSRLSFASLVLVVLRSSVLKALRISHYLTKPTHLWTSSRERKMQDLFT